MPSPQQKKKNIHSDPLENSGTGSGKNSPPTPKRSENFTNEIPARSPLLHPTTVAQQRSASGSDNLTLPQQYQQQQQQQQQQSGQESQMQQQQQQHRTHSHSHSHSHSRHHNNNNDNQHLSANSPSKKHQPSPASPGVPQPTGQQSELLLAEAMHTLGQVGAGISPHSAGEHITGYDSDREPDDDDDNNSTGTSTGGDDDHDVDHDSEHTAHPGDEDEDGEHHHEGGGEHHSGGSGAGAGGAGGGEGDHHHDLHHAGHSAGDENDGHENHLKHALHNAVQVGRRLPDDHSRLARAKLKKASAAVMASLRVSKHLWDNSATATQLSRGDVSNPLDAMHENLHKLLWNIPHVNVLRPEELRSLNVMIREYGTMDMVLDRGTEIQHVYALVSGTVEVFDDRNLRHIEKRVGSVNAPNLFGMDGIVFDVPSQFTMRAGAKCVMVLIPKREFLTLLKSNRQFAHSLSTPIVEHMGVFGVFQDFCRAVFTTTTDVAAASDGTCLNLTAILTAYRKLNNVIHPLVNEPEIDVGGWLYASRRLPENIPESLVINLARALPPFLAKDLRSHVQEGSTTGGKPVGDAPDENVDESSDILKSVPTTVKFIPTHDRRRCTWQIGDKGHTFVLLRESYTDVLDFITCMCIHIVESQKLRQRLRSMTGIRAVDVLHIANCKLRQLERGSSEFEKEAARITEESLNVLKLSEAEKQGLQRIWPKTCLSTMYEILLHREEYMITLDSGTLGRFDVDPYVVWAMSLRSSLLKYLGLSEVDEIPEDVTIDVISSNTHGTKNCLCSSIRFNSHKIEEWAQEKIPQIAKLSWYNRQDLLFFCWAKMIAEDKELQKEYVKQLSADGFTIIEDSAMTGLQVDIVELASLNVEAVDTELQTAARHFKKSYEAALNPSRCFLINMDFAFGAQADYITHALILVFGRHIRSFNVMGKAGALVGKRGDCQLPTSIVFSKSALGEDSTDENRSCGNEDLLPERMRELCGPTRDVHVGPVLTIPGTLLQNEKLLRFYKTVIGCVGLEMEGTYFARQLEEAIETGLLDPYVRRRFAYYTSDLPLRTQSASLSKPMTPNEGIPPMYAIMRGILERVFTDAAERQMKSSPFTTATAVSPFQTKNSASAAATAAAGGSGSGSGSGSFNGFDHHPSQDPSFSGMQQPASSHSSGFGNFRVVSGPASRNISHTNSNAVLDEQQQQQQQQVPQLVVREASAVSSSAGSPYQQQQYQQQQQQQQGGGGNNWKPFPPASLERDSSPNNNNKQSPSPGRSESY